jgi:hypothetical protein
MNKPYTVQSTQNKITKFLYRGDNQGIAFDVFDKALLEAIALQVDNKSHAEIAIFFGDKIIDWVNETNALNFPSINRE